MVLLEAGQVTISLMPAQQLALRPQSRVTPVAARTVAALRPKQALRM